MTDTPAPIPAAQLADSINCAKLHAKYESGPDGDHDLAITLDDLLAHIDAQAAEIERLTRERDEALKLAKQRLAGWAMDISRADTAEAKLAALAEPVGEQDVRDCIIRLSSAAPQERNDEVVMEIMREAASLLCRLSSSLARARGALKLVEPHLDAIVCYASTMDEHEPNRIAVTVRETLATLTQPEKADDADA